MVHQYWYVLLNHVVISLSRIDICLMVKNVIILAYHRPANKTIGVVMVQENRVMRFLIVTKDLFTGGAERVAVSQANILSRAGHDVHLLMIEGRKSRYNVDSGVHLHYMDFLYVRSKKTRFIEHKRLARKIESEYAMIEDECGGIDETFFHYYAGYSRYLRGRNKFTFWLHNPYPIDPLPGVVDKWKNRRALSGGKLVSVSSYIKETCIIFDSDFFSDISVIFNPFDKDEIRHDAVEEIDSPSEDYIVGCGRLNIDHKGWDWLISSYKRSGVACDLVIVGEGEDRKKLEDQIISEGLVGRVHLVGGKDNPYPWISNAKCLVLPSYFEGFGNVLVEALMLGVPIVSSDCGGPSDILYGDLRSWLVPVGDINALSEKINEVFYSPYCVDDSYIYNYDVGKLVSDLEGLSRVYSKP